MRPALMAALSPSAYAETGLSTDPEAGRLFERPERDFSTGASDLSFIATCVFLAGARAFLRDQRRTATEQLVDALASSDTHQPHVFRQEGDYWTIAYAGRVIRLHDMRGFHYLVHLLRHPAREFHATQLVGANGPGAPGANHDAALTVVVGLGDAGTPLDARAVAAYRRRLAEVDEEIADAERCNDLGRIAAARAERDALLVELTDGARRRATASHAERARVTVTKGIKAALTKIETRHPTLAAHLAATVRRGYFCAYVPDPRHPIEWQG